MNRACLLLLPWMSTLAIGCSANSPPSTSGVSDPNSTGSASPTASASVAVATAAPTSEPTATASEPPCGEGDGCPADRCRKVMVPCADLDRGCRTESRFVRCVPKGVIGPPAMICSRDKTTGEICVSAEGQGIPGAESCGSAEMDRFGAIKKPCPAP